MANVQHKDIVDPNIHEPKGIGLAPAGTAYIANGAGSGAWAEVLVPSSLGIIASNMYTFDKKVTTDLPNNSLFPISTWSLQSNWGDTKVTPISGFLEVSKTGIYLINSDYSVTVDGDGYYTVATLTKTKSSLTTLQAQMVSGVRGEDSSGGAGGYVGYGVFRSVVVRLEAGQGVGFWVTGVRGISTSGVTDTRIQGFIQMTRLSDG